MSKHLSWAGERTEFITYVKAMIPELSSALQKDDWETIDRVIIQIKGKAKEFGIMAGLTISMEIKDLWEMVWEKVEAKAREHGIPHIPGKEVLNILSRAFEWYGDGMINVGLKEPLEKWIERMEKHREKTGSFPFPSTPSIGSVHFGH